MDEVNSTYTSCEMRSATTFFLSLLMLLSIAYAQVLTHGPLVGGVTESSARIYFGFDNTVTFSIQVAKDTLFTSPIPVSATADAGSYYAVIADVTGLDADTRYYYRINTGSSWSSKLGTFKTFPAVGDTGYYRVVVGSCNYHDHYAGGGATSPDTYYNDVLFGSIIDFDPHIVLHLGDWNYPPSALGAYYNLDPQKVNQSFRLRYQDYNFSTHIMPNIPVDYIYDDDNSQNGNAGWTYPTISTGTDPLGGTYYILEDQPMPSGVREGAIEGYFNNFPGYAQVDTSGIHHSFKLGNIEFFVLDTRSSKDPVHEVFQFNSLLYTYTFSPPPGHTTLGEAQRDWLLDGLKNSTADWKVVCSSVVFNQNFGSLMSLLIPVQLIDRSVIELAAAIAYMWPGYPEDSDALLDAINANDIKNVVMLSGDTHSSMIDNGSNAGLPELSASGWAAGNEAILNWSIDSVAQRFSLGLTSVKDFLWNGGGSGIDNTNFSDTYGTMEFFYTDSLRMCVIDEFDQVLACQTIMYDSSSPVGVRQYVPETMFLVVYPNPAKDQLKILMRNAPQQEVSIQVVDLQGKVVIQQQFTDEAFIIPIQQLAGGTYLLQVESGGHLEQRKFVKH